MRKYSPERFDALVQEFNKHSIDIMLAKREEYSPSEDRLQNFHEVSTFEGRRPSEVAMSYMLKHMQSLMQAVRTGEYDWCWTKENGTGEGLKQRIADVINYCYLLAACLDEENEIRQQRG